MAAAPRHVRMSARGWLAAIIVAHLVLGVLFAIFVPLNEKLDEAMHWNYVRYLREWHKLPDQREAFMEDHPGEFHQPPLYYVIGALLTAPIPRGVPTDNLPKNNFYGAFMLSAVPDNANLYLHDPAREGFPWRGDVLSMWMLRGMSLLLSAAALIPLFGLARLALADDRLALGAVAWLAFLPSNLSVNAGVTNDSLMLLVGTALLYALAGGVVRGFTWRRAAVLGLLLGIAALTKHTFAATAIATPLAFALSPGFRQHWRERIGQFGLVVALALLVSGWFFARNLVLYGDPTGLAMMNARYGLARSAPPTWAEAARTGRTIFLRYWAHFGAVGMPDWVNVGLAALTAALLLGIVRLLIKRSLGRVAPHAHLNAWLGIVLVLYLAQLAFMFRVSLHGGQIRYILPGFGALAVMQQVGLSGLVGVERRRLAAILPAALLIPLALYAALGVLRPAYDLPRFAEAPDTLRYDQPVDARFGDGIRLVGVSLPRGVRLGQAASVRLCWAGDGPTDRPLPYFVQLVDENDTKAAARHTHTGLGMYPTNLWGPGTAFCDDLLLPVNADAEAPKVYRLLVGFFDEETSERLPVTLADGSVQDFVAPGVVAVWPNRWPDAPPLAYRLGDAIGLSRPDVEAGGADGETDFTVDVTCLALAEVKRDYTVFVHLLGPDGVPVAQTDVRPRGGTFPTAFWPKGAVVRDRITVPVGPDVPPGTYRLVLGMYDSASLERLPVVDTGGASLPDGLIDLGTAEVDDHAR
jgi:hypothetical protein